MKNDPSNRPIGILCYDNFTFGFELDLFIYSIIQQLFSASLPSNYGSENKDD